MPSEPIAPVRGRQVVALRSCLLYPQGLQHEAYPSVMPILRKLGLVVSRPARGPGRKDPAWFITEAGREQLAEIDAAKRRARAARPRSLARVGAEGPPVCQPEVCDEGNYRYPL